MSNIKTILTYIMFLFLISYVLFFKKFIAFDSDNQDSERKDKALFPSNAIASICMLIVAGVALIAATII